MEEKPRSIAANSLWYGVITGAALIVFSLLMFLAGLHTKSYLNYIGYVILIGGMVWGTMEYRNKYLGGFMPYAKAFTSCFLIGLFAGVLIAIYTWVFAQYIHPGFIQELLDISREKIVESSANMSEEQIEQALEMSAKFMSPVMMAVWSFLAYVFASAILGLIVAIFMKKEDKSVTQV